MVRYLIKNFLSSYLQLYYGTGSRFICISAVFESFESFESFELFLSTSISRVTVKRREYMTFLKMLEFAHYLDNV